MAGGAGWWSAWTPVARRWLAELRASRPWGVSPGLTAIIVVWWLVVGAVLVGTWPEPARSAAVSGEGSVFKAGQVVRIDHPGFRKWQMPVDRVAFDELAKAARQSDEDALERWTAATAWVVVEHGQAVRVETVDGDAVQVCVLDGRVVGQRGWMRRQRLSP